MKSGHPVVEAVLYFSILLDDTILGVRVGLGGVTYDNQSCLTVLLHHIDDGTELGALFSSTSAAPQRPLKEP